MRFRTRALSAALGATLLCLACDRDGSPDPKEAAALPPSASAAAPGSAPPGEKWDLLASLERCEVRHRGLLLDLGTRAARARNGFRVEPIDEVKDAEREGASVARLLGQKIVYELVTDEPLEEVSLVVRAFGSGARSMSAVLDDRRIGSVRLAPGETRQLEFPVLKAPLAAGRHTLTLSFQGRPRGSDQPQAELDWIRLGPPDEQLSSYAAPTLRDLITNATLDGAPRKVLALRAPASIRCPMTVSRDALLRADLGFWGEGKGSADVRVLADGEEPIVLAERKVTGGDGATWSPLEVPLGEHADRVIALELRALEATRGGRVLFGDPTLVRPLPPARVPEASTVIVVLAAGIDRRSIPPWGAAQALPALAELAKSSAVYTGYRVPSTVVAAVVASILTALPPGVHALEDPAARLPSQARMLGELVKEASGRTAMFTSVPTTSAPFGFDSGWDRFEAVSPVADAPAEAPILGATKWLERDLGEWETARRLVVIHTRGAHPPWDLSKEEAGRLPPEDYAGVLDPRRGGVVLAKLRGAKRQKHKLTDPDWVRLKAFAQAALAKQDQALGQLIALLKRKGAWDSTLLVFAGDVSPGEPPELPFDPAGGLDEARLVVPLLIKFPGGKLAAKEVPAGVTTMDLGATVLAALGLKAPGGLDLYAVGEGVTPLSGRALSATLGEAYATRLGPWLLRGVIGKTPALCQLDVDPACVNDVFSARPIASSAAWRWTYEAFDQANRGRVAAREPASIDPDTGAALTVWGDI